MAGKGRRQQPARAVTPAKEASPRLAAHRPASPSRARPANLSLPLIAGEVGAAHKYAEVSSCRARIPVPVTVKDDGYTESPIAHTAPRIPVQPISSKEVVAGSWTAQTWVVGNVEVSDVRPFAEDLVGMA